MSSRHPSVRATAFALALAGLTGCWGSIGDPGATGGECGPAPNPGARRLSNAEYRNTVRDLFPGLALPDLDLVADPSPYGFDNDAATLQASRLLVNQYNSAAVAIAERVRARQAEFVPCMPSEGSACGAQYIADLAPRAYRRPLSQVELDTLQGVFDHYLAQDGWEAAVELTTQVILQSPAFLYRVEAPGPTGDSSPYDVAARLSYLLWSSMPDAPLFDAAATGRLRSEADIAAQVDRMLDDPRAIEGFMNWSRQWLALSRLDTVAKEEGWSDALREALSEEARRFLADVIFARRGTVRDLLTSRRVFVTAETAPLYGLPAPAAGTWVETELPAGEGDRRGFLLQAQFLAAHGHPNNPSPVLRGLFVLKQFLCVELGSPPAGVDMTIPDDDPAMGPTTNRENYDRATGGEVCRTCHSVINPIGFTFEHFDTLGRYRADDGGLAIDPSGGFGTATFADHNALIEHLAGSRQVTDCVTKKYLTYALAGPASGGDVCLTRDLQGRFADSGGDLRQLVRDLATHPRFLGLTEQEAP